MADESGVDNDWPYKEGVNEMMIKVLLRTLAVKKSIHRP